MIWLIILGGGLGSALRQFVGEIVSSKVKRKNHWGNLPWATLTVNLTGAFTLGFLVAFFGAFQPYSEWLPIFSTGMMGGYTTFSAASLENWQLIKDKQYGLAMVNGVGQLALAVLLAGLGVFLGTLLFSSLGTI